MILAVITISPELISDGGNAPVFIVASRQEQEKIALILGRILKGMVHDLENGVLIIVRH